MKNCEDDLGGESVLESSISGILIIILTID